MDEQSLTQQVLNLVQTGVLNDLVDGIVNRLKEQPSDFRDHTCGECAWELNGFCRRNSWGIVYPQVCLGNNNSWCEPGYMSDVAKDAPACPAYVPKVKP